MQSPETHFLLHGGLLAILALAAIGAAVGLVMWMRRRSKGAAAGAVQTPSAGPAPVQAPPTQAPPTAAAPSQAMPVQAPASVPGDAPPAGHDVFISHSSKDKTTADMICAVLEQNGIHCWVAPRDVYPGEEWAQAIIRAISGARVFVLIFSHFANESSQIKREVERAANHEVPIIPFRIEDVPANETLEYFISTPHWLDAFTPPLQEHADRLVATIKRLLDKPREARAAQPLA